MLIQVPSKKATFAYQDLWVNGKVAIKGLRECEKRFESIYTICKEFNRPISVLDVGADMGYFSFRLAERLPGTYVMIESDPSTLDSLLHLCEFNAHPQTILLSKRVNLADLKKLKITEHFDVVLALSIIHHFKEPAQEVLEALADLGTFLFFEPPAAEEQYLELDLSRFTTKKLVISKSLASVERTTYLISALSGKRKKSNNAILFSTFMDFDGIYPYEAAMQKMVIKNFEENQSHDFLFDGCNLISNNRK